MNADELHRQRQARARAVPGVDLHGIDLSGLDLHGALLLGANLSNANLFNAKLINADLSSANLSGAIVTQEQLDTAASLQGVTMPDGTIHP